MDSSGGSARREVQASGAGESTEDVLNLGAWFQKGWDGAGNPREEIDSVTGAFDRFREADALGYDNEGDQIEN